MMESLGLERKGPFAGRYRLLVYRNRRNDSLVITSDTAVKAEDGTYSFPEGQRVYRMDKRHLKLEFAGEFTCADIARWMQNPKQADEIGYVPILESTESEPEYFAIRGDFDALAFGDGGLYSNPVTGHLHLMNAFNIHCQACAKMRHDGVGLASNELFNRDYECDGFDRAVCAAIWVQSRLRPVEAFGRPSLKQPLRKFRISANKNDNKI